MSKKLPLLYKFILCLLTVLLLETPLVLAQVIPLDIQKLLAN